MSKPSIPSTSSRNPRSEQVLPRSSAQQWKVRNTFIEPDDEPDSDQGSGSHSDGEILFEALANRNDSSSSDLDKRQEQLTDLRLWHRTWSSSASEKSSSSSAKQIRVEDAAKQKAALELLSQGLTKEAAGTQAIQAIQAIFADSGDSADSGDFPLNEALQVHQKISDLSKDKVDIKTILSTHFANVDVNRYVPVDPSTGEYLSLGSVRHMVGDCTPCMFVEKNRCHKGAFCLHCHFGHEGFEIHRPSKKMRMKLKKKMNAAAANQSNQLPPTVVEERNNNRSVGSGHQDIADRDWMTARRPDPSGGYRTSL